MTVFAVAPVHLALDQQRQALFKGQLAGGDVGGGVAEGSDHAVQAQGAQLVEGLFVEHGCCTGCCMGCCVGCCMGCCVGCCGGAGVCEGGCFSGCFFIRAFARVSLPP